MRVPVKYENGLNDVFEFSNAFAGVIIGKLLVYGGTAIYVTDDFGQLVEAKPDGLLQMIVSLAC